MTLQISQLASVTAPLTMVYSGDANYAGCTSPPVQLTYQTTPLASQIGYTLFGFQNVVAGTPLAVSAGVAAATPPPTSEPSYPVPTGTVQLAIDGVNAGFPVQLTPASGSIPNGSWFGPYGAASLTIATSSLSAGMHTTSLSYSGDSNYLPSTSSGAIFSLLSLDFSISANPALLTVTNGQTTGTSEIEIGAQNGFIGTVTLSCTGLPSEATCVFSPNTVTNSGNSSLTIITTQAEVVRGGVIAHHHSGPAGWMTGAGGISIASLTVLLASRRRRKYIWLCIAAVGVFALGPISCGGGSSSQNTITQPTQFATTTTLSASTSTPAKGASDTFTATVTSAESAAPSAGSVQFSVDGVVSQPAVPLT